MAKKVDLNEQKEKYIDALIPAVAANGAIISPVTAGTSQGALPVQNHVETPSGTAPGRKKQGMEVKTRTSFSLEPSDLLNLKRIAFIENKTISSILSEHVKAYVAGHQKELHEFSALPEAVQKRVESSNI